ncbi:MAG: DUF4214 domain-containing protein, partial [Acidimicrobiia bacterium]
DSGDSCEIAIRYTNTSERDLAGVQLGFASLDPDNGPDIESTSDRPATMVAGGQSAVAHVIVRFDQLVGPSAIRLSASGTFVDTDEPFIKTVTLTYNVNAAPPTVPRSASANWEGRTVHVSWDRPVSHGGSMVTGYRVQLVVDHPDWLAGESGAKRWLYDQIVCVAPADARACEVSPRIIQTLPPGQTRIALTTLTELAPEGGYTYYTEPRDRGHHGRAPDSFGQAMTLEELVAAANFDDALDVPILRFYVAYFDRSPDLAGAKYWLDVRRQGFSLDQIATFMARSVEFAAAYEGISNAEYVDQIYRNVLGRQSDDAGYSYWLGLLDDGTLTRPGVVRWMTAGQEFSAIHPFLPSTGASIKSVQQGGNDLS